MSFKREKSDSKSPKKPSVTKTRPKDGKPAPNIGSFGACVVISPAKK